MAIEVRNVTLPYDIRLSYDNEPFYKAAHEEGKFVIQKCADCGEYYWPAAFLCQHCGGTNVEWTEASGHGKLYSKVHCGYAFTKPLAEFTPYGLCSVILDEGPRVFGRLIGYENIEAVPYDAPVHLVWLRDVEKGITIMGWELDD